jgi:8-oxo-dGTP pyrophosphatase MutT (NUDIX family)
MSLPGLKIQLEMAAVDRLEEMQRSNLSKTKPRKASVMMLIYPIKDVPYFALIERTTSAGKHSGQIAFPGGRYEIEDIDNEATAKRETMEEIGVPLKDQEVICAGTPLYIPPSNYMVSPYLAFAKAKPSFIPQLSEVKSILEIRLAELLDEENVRRTTLSTSYMQNVEVPCFMMNGQIVWGATAMILQEFKTMLLEINTN